MGPNEISFAIRYDTRLISSLIQPVHRSADQCQRYRDSIRPSCPLETMHQDLVYTSWIFDWQNVQLDTQPCSLVTEDFFGNIDDRNPISSQLQ
jgi:hypothetical protein